MDSQNLLANSNVRVLLGLSSALIIVFVAFFFVDDALLRWVMIGVAAVDAVTTPYVLKLAIENADRSEPGQQAQ